MVDAKKDSLNQLPSSLVTKAANTFSRNLYKELSKENSDNLIVSPFSLSTALAMITPGAKGLTLSQVVFLLFENILKDNISRLKKPYLFLLLRTPFLDTGFVKKES